MEEAYKEFLEKSGHSDTHNLKEAFSAGYEAGAASSTSSSSELPPDVNR